MIEKIDIMLENIIERITTALPSVTSIDKIQQLAMILIEIKASYKEKDTKIISNLTKVEEMKEEI